MITGLPPLFCQEVCRGKPNHRFDVQAPSLGSLSSSSESIAFPFRARSVQCNRHNEHCEQHKKPSSNWRTRAEFTLCSSSQSWYHHHLSHRGTSAGSFPVFSALCQAHEKKPSRYNGRNPKSASAPYFTAVHRLAQGCHWSGAAATLAAYVSLSLHQHLRQPVPIIAFVCLFCGQYSMVWGGKSSVKMTITFDSPELCLSVLSLSSPFPLYYKHA